MEFGEIINFDSSEAYDDFNRTKSSQHRRRKGFRALQMIETALAKAHRAADLTRKPLDFLLKKSLEKAPHAIQHMAKYLEKRGFKPSSDLGEMSAQLAHAWNEHTIETKDHYDSDNFDPDNFSFSSSKRRNKRKAKRADRKERRNQRRANRKGKNEERINDLHKGGEDATDIAEATTPPQEKAIEDQRAQEAAAEPLENENANNVTSQPVQAEAVLPEPSEIKEAEDPTGMEAEAENFGEMLESNSFDGYDGEEMIPFYGFALELGRRNIEKYRRNLSAGNFDGYDKTKIGKLFKKDGTVGKLFGEGSTLGSAVGDLNLKDVVNMFKKKPNGTTNITPIEQAGNELMKKIESQKKTNFLKQNAIWFVVIIIALIVIGKSMSNSTT